jgi:hypothetical protein
VARHGARGGLRLPEALGEVGAQCGRTGAAGRDRGLGFHGAARRAEASADKFCNSQAASRRQPQPIERPRFSGRRDIWISFRLAWISFRRTWISFRPAWNSFRRLGTASLRPSGGPRLGSTLVPAGGGRLGSYQIFGASLQAIDREQLGVRKGRKGPCQKFPPCPSNASFWPSLRAVAISSNRHRDGPMRRRETPVDGLRRRADQGAAAARRSLGSLRSL